METLQDAVDEVAQRSGFSGVVRLDRAGETELVAAYGLADRAHGLAEHRRHPVRDRERHQGPHRAGGHEAGRGGTLELGTTARSLLGDDLPLVADDVTVEHLLAHRSGIGDYLDEDAARRRGRLRPVGPGAHPGDGGGLPRGARRASPGLGAGRAVLLQQRRLRAAGAARRAGRRRRLPRARPHAGLRAGRHGRHRLPALRRAPGRRCPRLPHRRRRTDQRAPPAGARRR